MTQQNETPNPAPARKSVFLIVNRQMIPLEKPLVRLGRQLDNDIVFYEEFVSRFHAEIRLEAGGYVVSDAKSTGGTFVNGRRIDRCVLNSGDIISIGTIQIMFVNNNTGLIGKARGMTQALHKNK